MTRKYTQRKSVSLQTLKDLYYKTTHGVSVADSARALGIEYATANMAVKYIRKYIARVISGDFRKNSNHRYLQVAKWAIEQDKITRRKAEQPAEIKVEVPEDQEVQADPNMEEPARLLENTVNRYTKLDLAFAVFSDQVQSFIAEEVKAQVGDVLKENAELKEAMDNARSFNWTEELKKKFDR